MVTTNDVIELLTNYKNQTLLYNLKQHELIALEEYYEISDETFEIEGDMLKASTISDMPSTFSSDFYSKTETVALKDIRHALRALKRITTKIKLALNKIDVLIENLSPVKQIIIKTRFITSDQNFTWNDSIEEIKSKLGRMITKRTCQRYRDQAIEELRTMLEKTQKI